MDLEVSQATEDSYIEIPLYYYPNYRAWIDGQEIPIERGGLGVIRVPLQDGNFRLEVDFVESGVWIAGDILSMVTALFLAGRALWLKYRSTGYLRRSCL